MLQVCEWVCFFHRMGVLDENILDQESLCGIKTFCVNITLERIPLMERLNMMPINQKAKEVLWEIDEEPLGDSLYCIQLIVSILNRGKIEAEEDLVQTLKAMMS